MELFHYPERCNVRTFYIEAIEIPIVYNKYGDHDPNGLLYVLQKDAGRIQRKALENFHQAVPQPYEEVRPLVLRANLGAVSYTHLNRCRNRSRYSHTYTKTQVRVRTTE